MNSMYYEVHNTFAGYIKEGHMRRVIGCGEHMHAMFTVYINHKWYKV